MSVNNFDVLKEMGKRKLDIQLAPLDNISRLRKTKLGTQVTIGVAGDLVGAIGMEGKYVGGLILANKAEFNAVKAEMAKASESRSSEEIQAEILNLAPLASAYDTELQSNDTCLAAGAHDALRWALGLAEEPVSKVLRGS